jgi:hypothetical protein
MRGKVPKKEIAKLEDFAHYVAEGSVICYLVRSMTSQCVKAARTLWLMALQLGSTFKQVIDRIWVMY